jgi:hypothetical protein
LQVIRNDKLKLIKPASLCKVTAKAGVVRLLPQKHIARIKKKGQLC